MSVHSLDHRLKEKEKPYKWKDQETVRRREDRTMQTWKRIVRRSIHAFLPLESLVKREEGEERNVAVELCMHVTQIETTQAGLKEIAWDEAEKREEKREISERLKRKISFPFLHFNVIYQMFREKRDGKFVGSQTLVERKMDMRSKEFHLKTNTFLHLMYIPFSFIFPFLASIVNTNRVCIYVYRERDAYFLLHHIWLSCLSPGDHSPAKKYSLRDDRPAEIESSSRQAKRRKHFFSWSRFSSL